MRAGGYIMGVVAMENMKAKCNVRQCNEQWAVHNDGREIKDNSIELQEKRICSL